MLRGYYILIWKAIWYCGDIIEVMFNKIQVLLHYFIFYYSLKYKSDCLHLRVYGPCILTTLFTLALHFFRSLAQSALSSNSEKKKRKNELAFILKSPVCRGHCLSSVLISCPCLTWQTNIYVSKIYFFFLHFLNNTTILHPLFTFLRSSLDFPSLGYWWRPKNDSGRFKEKVFVTT